MADSTDLMAVRGRSDFNYPEDNDSQPNINNRGDQLIAQSLPELTELVRMGVSWQVALASGLAALTALPTTVAGISLWNGETGASGMPARQYAIDSFGSWEAVADATQPNITAIFACNNVSPVTAPTATALTMRGLSGNAYGGKARAVSALTITNDGWFAHATDGNAANGLTGAGSFQWRVNEVKCRGLYMVKPGGCFNVQAVKAVAAAAAQQFFFIRWHEVMMIAN